MPNNDPLITPSGVPTLPSLPNLPSDTMTAPKQRSGFWKVLGGIAGTATNIFAPGMGSIIGGIIGGGSGSYYGNSSTSGSYASIIAEQQRSHAEMMQMNASMNNIQQQQNMDMMGQQQKNSIQLIGLQTQIGQQSQEFSTVSNLLKSRHDSEMTAVNNFKS